MSLTIDLKRMQIEDERNTVETSDEEQNYKDGNRETLSMNGGHCPRTGNSSGKESSRVIRCSAMDEDEFYPKSLQEELNEITEAFYAMISEDGIKKYQQYVEDISQKRVAEGAIGSFCKAPDFELEDQDGDLVKLSSLLQKGSVVLVFYRGKWCPHCNATIMKLQRTLKEIERRGATLIAISPMLPDGTQFLATKRDLQFSVCSDVGNKVAKKYHLTFEVLPDVRDTFLEWGDDLPMHNGDSRWEIPLPATHIIDTNGIIVWSFVDNDPGVRAEPEDILDAIPPSGKGLGAVNSIKPNKTITKKSLFNRRSISSTFKTSVKRAFGKKKQAPQDFVSQYLLPNK